jgi:hypothetical protein
VGKLRTSLAARRRRQRGEEFASGLRLGDEMKKATFKG